jgi:hypothetical protein
MCGSGEWGQSIGAEEAGNVGFDDGACRLIGGNPRDLRRSGDAMVLCAMLCTVVMKAVIVKLRSVAWVKRFTMVIVVFVSSDYCDC